MRQFLIILLFIFFSCKATYQNSNKPHVLGEWKVVNYKVSSYICSPIPAEKIPSFENFLFEFTDNNQLYFYYDYNDNNELKEKHLRWEFGFYDHQIYLLDMNGKEVFYSEINYNEDRLIMKFYMGLLILHLEKTI